MLKKQTLTDDVRDSLVKMIVHALKRDYILSHEAYMEMAVGMYNGVILRFTVSYQTSFVCTKNM